MPITARHRALSGGPVRRGAMLATFEFSRTHSSAAEGFAFPGTSGAWAVSTDGAGAGFAARGARLTAPDGCPDGWIGLEAVGGDESPGALMPWVDEIHAGAGGAGVALGEDRRVSVRVRNDRSPRDVRVHGAGTAIAQGDAVRLYAVIG